VSLFLLVRKTFEV